MTDLTQTTTTPETIATDTAPSTAPSTPEVSTPPVEGTTASPEGQVAAPPAYTVNPVYKVKNMEKKFPDFLLPVIKDAKTEEQIREILQKADGVEFVKQDRQSLKEENSQYKQRISQVYAPMEQAVNRFVHFRNQGDLDGAFQVLGLQPQNVLQWALKYAQMAPEARDAAQRASTQTLQAMDAQTQQQTMQQQYQQQLVEYRQRELDWTMQRPEVNQAIQAFDAQHGPGAFKNEVIRRGQYYAYQGKDISAEEAVTETLKLLKPLMSSPQMPTQAVSQVPDAPVPEVQSPQAQAPKQVIPNIQGRGTSPAKVVPKSLADLRKLGKQLSAD